MTKRTKIATQILERAYARELLKTAVGAAPGLSSPAVWSAKPMPMPVQQPKPTTPDLTAPFSAASTATVGLAHAAGGRVLADTGALGRGLTRPGSPWNHFWDSATQLGQDAATAGAYDVSESLFGNRKPGEDTWVQRLRNKNDLQQAEDPRWSASLRGATAFANNVGDTSANLALFNAAGGPRLVRSLGSLAVAAPPVLNYLTPFAPPAANTVNRLAAAAGAPKPFAPYQTETARAYDLFSKKQDYIAYLNQQRANEEQRQQLEAAQYMAGAANQLQRADNSDYAADRAMSHDPAIQNRINHLDNPRATVPLQAPPAAENTPESAAPAADSPAGAASAEVAENPAAPIPDATAAAAQTAATPASAPPQLEPPQAAEPAQAGGAAAPPAAAAETPAAIPSEQAQKIRTQADTQLIAAASTAAGDTNKLKPAIAAWANAVKPTLSADMQVGASHVAAGNYNTPEAQNFIKQHMEPAQQKFVADITAKDPGNLTLAGQALGMWDNLGTGGQLALGLGISASLIGLLGGSGLSMLLGALGIGAAGLFGAAGGAFGEDAQRSFGQGVGAVGKMLGLNVPETADVTRLAGNNAPGELSNKITAGLSLDKKWNIATNPANRKMHAQSMQAELKAFDDMQQLARMPESLAVPWLMSAGKADGKQLSPDVARQVYRNATLTAQMAADKDSPVAKQIARARQYVADPDAYVQQELNNAARRAGAAVGDTARQAGRWISDNVSGWLSDKGTK